MAAAGPLTLRLAHFAAAAAAVAASPPSGDPGRGGGGLHRACPKGRGRGGRASGRTDPAAADGRSLSPARLQPEPPAAPAHARSGAVTRARRAPPPAGRRHLRAGAGERAAGARRPRALRGARRGRSAPTCWVRVRTHLPFLSPFYYYYFFLAWSPLIPPWIYLFFLLDSFPSLLPFVCLAADQTTHLSICGGREAGPNPPLLLGGCYGNSPREGWWPLDRTGCPPTQLPWQQWSRRGRGLSVRTWLERPRGREVCVCGGGGAVWPLLPFLAGVGMLGADLSP